MHPADFQRILAAIDFSPAAANVVRQAAWMAERAYCSLILMHVTERVQGGIRQASYALQPGYFANDPVKLTHQLRTKAEKRLEAFAAELRQRGLNVEPLTSSGHPGAEIIAAVERENIDLVVAGRRGFSRWKYCLLGSTARQLVHECPCAVWAVQSPSQRWLKSVLAPVDFSRESGSALEHAAWLAEETNCRLCALHVIEPPDWIDWFRGLARGENHVQWQDPRTEALAWDRLAAFVKEHTHRLRDVKMRVVFGNPVQEMKRAAKRTGAGIIVIGSSAPGVPWKSWNRGVAEAMLDACKCSIFTVRPQDGNSSCDDAIRSASGPLDETLLTRDLERYRTDSPANSAVKGAAQ